MSENKVNSLLGVSMDKIKEMVDVNTVIGDPITAPDGTTVIPVSRVSYGFAGGGSDLPSKAQPEKGLFAGGSGGRFRKTSAIHAPSQALSMGDNARCMVFHFNTIGFASYRHGGDPRINLDDGPNQLPPAASRGELRVCGRPC